MDRPISKPIPTDKPGGMKTQNRATLTSPICRQINLCGEKLVPTAAVIYSSDVYTTDSYCPHARAWQSLANIWGVQKIANFCFDWEPYIYQDDGWPPGAPDSPIQQGTLARCSEVVCDGDDSTVMQDFWRRISCAPWYVKVLEMLYALEPFPNDERRFVTGRWEKINDVLPATVANSIRADLTRTMPQATYMEPGMLHHSVLRRMLEVYAAIDPEVGYVQGVNYLACSLLIHFISYTSQRKHNAFLQTCFDDDFMTEKPTMTDKDKKALLYRHHLSSKETFLISPEQMEEEARLMLVFIYIMHGCRWRECFLPGFPRLAYLATLIYEVAKRIVSNSSKEGEHIHNTLDHFKSKETIKLLISDHALTLGCYQIPTVAQAYFITDLTREREFAFVRIMVMRIIMVAKAFRSCPYFGLASHTFSSPEEEEVVTHPSSLLATAFRKLTLDVFQDSRTLNRSNSMNMSEFIEIWKHYTPSHARNDIRPNYPNPKVIVTGNSELHINAIPEPLKRDLFSKFRPRPPLERPRVMSKLEEDGHFSSAPDRDENFVDALVGWVNTFNQSQSTESYGPLTVKHLDKIRVSPTLAQFNKARSLNFNQPPLSSPTSSSSSPSSEAILERSLRRLQSNLNYAKSHPAAMISKDHNVVALYFILKHEPRPPTFIGRGRASCNDSGITLSSVPTPTSTPPSTPSFSLHQELGLATPIIPSMALSSSSSSSSPSSIMSSSSMLTSPASSSSVLSPTSSPNSNFPKAKSFNKLPKKNLNTGKSGGNDEGDEGFNEDLRYLNWRNHWMQIVIEARRCTFRLEDYNKLLRENRQRTVNAIQRELASRIDPRTPDLSPVSCEPFPFRDEFSGEPQFKEWRRYFKIGMDSFRKNFCLIDHTPGSRTFGDPALLFSIKDKKKERDSWLDTGDKKDKKIPPVCKQGGKFTMRVNHQRICQKVQVYVQDELIQKCVLRTGDSRVLRD